MDDIVNTTLYRQSRQLWMK